MLAQNKRVLHRGDGKQYSGLRSNRALAEYGVGDYVAHDLRSEFHQQHLAGQDDSLITFWCRRQFPEEVMWQSLLCNPRWQWFAALEVFCNARRQVFVLVLPLAVISAVRLVVSTYDPDLILSEDHLDSDGFLNRRRSRRRIAAGRGPVQAAAAPQQRHNKNNGDTHGNTIG